jgi:hypothetical protein
MDRYETIDGQTIIAVRVDEDWNADLYTEEGQFITVNCFRDKIVGGIGTLTLEEALEEVPEIRVNEWTELRRPT